MDILVGHFYYRKGSGKANVRKVLAVGEKISFEYVYGPQRKRTPFAEVSHRGFLRWTDGEVPAGKDFRDLDGGGKFEPVECEDMDGKVIFRCTPKKATWFVKKGYAAWEGHRIRAIGDGIIRRLASVYRGDLDNPFFLEKKNERCVVCGDVYHLTRHHVVPRRHLKRVPMSLRKCLSNILWVCEACHMRYEQMGEPSGFNKSDPNAWRDHFVKTMAPSYIPQGWDIILPIATVTT